MRYSQQRLGSKSFCLPLSKQGWYTRKQIEFCIGCELAFSRTSSLFSPQLIKLLHSVPKGRLFLPSLVTGTSRRIQILRFSTFGPSHVEWWKAVRKPLIIESVGYYVFLRQFDTEHQLSLFYFLDLCSEKSSHPSSLLPCYLIMNAAFVQTLFMEKRFTPWQVAGTKRSFSPELLHFYLMVGWRYIWKRNIKVEIVRKKRLLIIKFP